MPLDAQNYKFKKLEKSNKSNKKFMAIFENRKTGREKKIYFGSAGMSDFTKHKDPERKARYIDRHQKREKWGNDGIMTAGWWSRWLLWSEPSLTKAKALVNSKLTSAGFKK